MTLSAGENNQLTDVSQLWSTFGFAGTHLRPLGLGGMQSNSHTYSDQTTPPIRSLRTSAICSSPALCARRSAVHGRGDREPRYVLLQRWCPDPGNRHMAGTIRRHTSTRFSRARDDQRQAAPPARRRCAGRAGGRNIAACTGHSIGSHFADAGFGPLGDPAVESGYPRRRRMRSSRYRC